MIFGEIPRSRARGQLELQKLERKTLHSLQLDTKELLYKTIELDTSK
jgi:hypothetical protein